MAWNGSNGKNTNGTSAAKRPVGGAKKSPSVMRGAFAALAVVALAAGAWWWMARSGGAPMARQAIYESIARSESEIDAGGGLDARKALSEMRATLHV